MGKIFRAHYDQSNKEFEVLRKEYIFDPYSRKMRYETKWQHYKYYKTLNSALEGCDYYRKFDTKINWDKSYENDFPHINPRIIIYRFKAVRRDDIE
jgi:outer membrane protein assembly factor BamD (BamD/ComL family)